MDESDNNTISRAKIFKGAGPPINYGVYMENCTWNTINESEIRDNGEGIRLINSDNNTIERNMIKRNGLDTGVNVTDGSDGNEIHWNCFIDNEPQAWDDGHDNNWDYNFWSDYPQWGEYNIPGAAGSKDHHTLRECGGSPQPAAVPALTPLGIIALVGLLSVVLAVSIRIGRKR